MIKWSSRIPNPLKTYGPKADKTINKGTLNFILKSKKRFYHALITFGSLLNFPLVSIMALDSLRINP